MNLEWHLNCSLLLLLACAIYSLKVEKTPDKNDSEVDTGNSVGLIQGEDPIIIPPPTENEVQDLSKSSLNNDTASDSYKWKPDDISLQIGHGVQGIFSKKPTHKVNPIDGEHPCFRECHKDPTTRMRCIYQFTLRQEQAFSSACGNCPNIQKDCFKPGCIPLDGVRRKIDTVNSRLPGTPIRVCEGDTLIVDLTNELPEGTSIHWHGIHQRTTPWMDGTAYVTNCPVPPHSSFRYEFEVPIGGTYFYHAHFAYQRGDGIFGALIVRKPEEKEPYGPRGTLRLYDLDLPEHEMVIMDWQKSDMRTALSGRAEFTDEDFYSNNILVNGKGMQRDFFDGKSDQKKMMPLHTVTVKKGFSYRLRLIMNGIKPCPLEMSIENHSMQVIASDGEDIDPAEVDSLVLYSGERWDIVIHAEQQIGSYWIKFKGFDACSIEGHYMYQVALLNYEGIPEGTLPNHFIKSYEEAAPPPGGIQLNPYNIGAENPHMTITLANLTSFHDDDPEISLRKPDHKFYIDVNFNDVPPGKHKAGAIMNFMGHILSPQVNDISNVLPTSPPLTQPERISSMQLCNNLNGHFRVSNHSYTIRNKGGKDCGKEYCACTHLLKVNYNSIVEIVLIDKEGFVDSNHPMHLHGQSFRVIGLEKINFNYTVDKVKEMDRKGLLQRRGAHGPIKDTVSVPNGGYTIIRFRADNRGFWYFHCHIELHLEMGMALILQVGKTSKMKKPPLNFPKCRRRKSSPK